MATRTPIVNISGDHEETVQRFAKHLGTDKIRRKLFDVIYGKIKRHQSKKEIMAMPKQSIKYDLKVPTRRMILNLN